MARSETAQRVAVAAVGIPLAAAAVYAGGWILGLLLATLAWLGAREFYGMAGAKGALALPQVGCAGAAALVLAAAIAPERGVQTPLLWAVLVVLTLTSLVAAIWVRGVGGGPLLGVSTTLFGAVYTGGMLAHGLFLRHLPPQPDPWAGTALVFAPVLLTWANDTFAYFVGRRFGKHKLIPRVSPGKTVEGALGAIVGTVLVAIGYAQILQAAAGYHLSLGGAVLLGILIAVAAQVGDLAESLLKRDAGVKDSGALFPGHGGALDRLDSLLFTLPLAYGFFWVIGSF